MLQGFGGGMLMPLGMTILTQAAGPHRVGRVMAIIGVPMLLGPILGPILGGWLAETSGAGAFASARVIVPGLIGVAMLAALGRHGLRTPDALIDLRLFANRVFSAASVTLILVIIAVFERVAPLMAEAFGAPG